MTPEEMKNAMYASIEEIVRPKLKGIFKYVEEVYEEAFEAGFELARKIYSDKKEKK